MSHLRLLFFLSTASLSGCHTQPASSPAADPNVKKALQPMGSQTSNFKLEKKLSILTALLDGKSDFDFKSNTENNTLLNEIYEIFPNKSLASQKKKTGLERDYLISEFYFYERRFIQASKLLSQILDQSPFYKRARNLLARCFYFLGNPDRAYLELDFVLKSPNAELEEMLDALFLKGAIALESPSLSKNNTKQGLKAWETYLRVSSKSELSEKIIKSMPLLKDKIQKPKTKAKTTTPKRTTSTRHEAITAFENNDLLLAESKLKKHLQNASKDPEAMVFLARIYIRTGRIKEASELFSKTTAQFPTYVPGWHYQGMCHIMSADPKEAIRSWEKVKELDPDYAKKFELESRIAVAKSTLSR